MPTSCFVAELPFLSPCLHIYADFDFYHFSFCSNSTNTVANMPTSLGHVTHVEGFVNVVYLPRTASLVVTNNPL